MWTWETSWTLTIRVDINSQDVKDVIVKGQRYGNEIIMGFENWLKRVPGFREAIEARRMKREERKIVQIA